MLKTDDDSLSNLSKLSGDEFLAGEYDSFFDVEARNSDKRRIDIVEHHNAKKNSDEDESDGAIEDEINMIQQKKEEVYEMIKKLGAYTKMATDTLAELTVIQPGIGSGSHHLLKTTATTDVAVKNERKEAPLPASVGVHHKDRNAARREKDRKRKAEQDLEMEKRREQEEARLKRMDEIKNSVRMIEKKRTKEQNEKVKIKRHKTGANGAISSVQVQLDGGAMTWMSVESYPMNDSLWKSAYNLYCQNRKKKRSSSPNLTKNDVDGNSKKKVKKGRLALPIGNPWINVNKDGEDGKEESSDVESEKKESSDVESETEPATCNAHELDKKGLVYMILKWKDNGSTSRAKVKQIMAKPMEKMAFEKTWFEYCDKKGYDNNLFRNEGVSVVKLVKGHEWDEKSGRPVAHVEWLHGESTKVVVFDTIMKKTDGNGMKAAWVKYCQSIDNVSKGFVEGDVDKKHKQETKTTKKKRKYFG
jgi:hypothetical protein